MEIVRNTRKKNHKWDTAECWRKASFASNGARTTGYPYEEAEKELGSLPHPIPQNYEVDYKPKSEKQNNKYLSRQSRGLSSR